MTEFLALLFVHIVIPAAAILVLFAALAVFMAGIPYAPVPLH